MPDCPPPHQHSRRPVVGERQNRPSRFTGKDGTHPVVHKRHKHTHTSYTHTHTHTHTNTHTHIHTHTYTHTYTYNLYNIFFPFFLFFFKKLVHVTNTKKRCVSTSKTLGSHWYHKKYIYFKVAYAMSENYSYFRK